MYLFSVVGYEIVLVRAMVIFVCISMVFLFCVVDSKCLLFESVDVD